VLESIVGRDFLPCGSVISNRRPLVLQLHKTDEGRRDYDEFLHQPRKKYRPVVLVNVRIMLVSKMERQGYVLLRKATALFVQGVMELCAGGELFDRIVKRDHFSEHKVVDSFGGSMVEPWLAAHGDSSRCVLVGVSSGANIADHVARKAVQAGNRLEPVKVVAQVVMYPFFIGINFLPY
jgi:hypothetical protein